eukprot:scpid74795/ scgid6403/ 
MGQDQCAPTGGEGSIQSASKVNVYVARPEALHEHPEGNVCACVEATSSTVSTASDKERSIFNCTPPPPPSTRAGFLSFRLHWSWERAAGSASLQPNPETTKFQDGESEVLLRGMRVWCSVAVQERSAA